MPPSKRCRFNSAGGSARPSSSREIAYSSPTLPALSRKERVSFKPVSSHVGSGLAIQNEDDGILQENENDIQIRENMDSMNEVIMALNLKDRGSVGCAYYVAREEKLCLMADISMGGLDIVDMLKVHAEPTTILVSTRCDETLEDHLGKDAKGIDRGEEANEIFGAYILDSRPAAEFSYDAAKNKLVNLDFEGPQGSDMVFTTPADDLVGGPSHDQEESSNNMGQQGRQMRMAGGIDLESKLSVGCAGAILSYLGRRKTIDYLPNDEEALIAFRVRTIQMFSLSDMMFVNADTLSSLRIIQSESHPNSHMQGPNNSSSGSKESLSVFGLFVHLASTPQGKHKLRQMFLRPSVDVAVIGERLKTIGFLLRSENQAALQKIRKSLKKVKDIRTVVVHMQKGVNSKSGKAAAVKSGIWGSIQKFSFNALKILEAIREMGGEEIEIFKKLLSQSHPHDLLGIGQIITQTINFDGSAELRRITVMQGIDPELDGMKRTYDGMESLLTEVQRKISQALPEWARQYVENCIYFPQLGFLTVVQLDPETGMGKYEGDGIEGDEWLRMFVSEEKGYYKNKMMREMDIYIGDMYSMITDREIEIIHDLTVRVLEHEKLLITVSDLFGELDSAVALALGALKYNFNAPTITSANIVHIVGGRHPLQELTVPSYVANDCFMVGGSGSKDDEDDTPEASESSDTLADDMDGPSMLLMSGPNYSGKSVYLKQTALIVYMAHIGSYVPAEKATIGLTDKILTRISTRESVSKNQSAFMIDLQQIALCMTLATRRSLVVIDEFGKGTNAVDGAGLACGTFEYFLGLDKQRPKVIGATHFHEIFENDFLPPRPKLSFGHMEVRIDREATLVEDQVAYLYNFVPGRSTSSFGTTCAAMNGIDSAIVERAEELILIGARGEDLMAALAANLSEKETKDLEDAERIGRRFLAQNFPLSISQNSVIDVRSILRNILDLET
ncbi:dna mismatch repair msh5 protein [Rutstroemia sp. NJR-2017a WRK4]|nr:dna mismatch repair msh5 protein [Rutstroemia sp. NJR-2017a WRK4]PQE14787.1 dna mismatch repair msh5 protein [Rutstroemia sp. NJR-2017a WRK4]